jgi:glycerol-3-phosphate dehydrogenase
MTKDVFYDVVIIGAGITGACVAYELSKTNAKVCLIEKENDTGCGASKANSGIIHAGYDPKPDTLMAKLNVRGTELYPELAENLNFEYERTGSLVVAFDEEGRKTVQKLFDQGIKNGVTNLQILEKEAVKKIEQNISDSVICALYAPGAGIINPYQATWAIAETAVINGVSFLRNCPVHQIAKSEDVFEVRAGSGIIRAKYVINCAGIHADKISEMAGARKFYIKQRRGEYKLFDSECGSLVKHIIFQTPTNLGKGVLVTPTIDRNILMGPSADDQDGTFSDYTGTTTVSQEEVLKKGLMSVPSLPSKAVITSFAGIRAIALDENKNNVNDFIIEEDSKVKHFINVAGICSPGLSAAPAIAEYVVAILKNSGACFSLKKNFKSTRKGIVNFRKAPLEVKNSLIKSDEKYGRIICRCETITEAEIVEAIHSPLGACDTDGVKRRCRAGMGRCQGGFCLPRITEIIAREKNISMTDVTKCGGSSFVLEK